MTVVAVGQIDAHLRSGLHLELVHSLPCLGDIDLVVVLVAHGKNSFRVIRNAISFRSNIVTPNQKKTPVFSRKQIQKIEKTEFKGFEIYIGKNNKQNDYIISKIAQAEDLWFHGLNFPSSHVILKLKNSKNKPTADVLEFCAKLVKNNSKAKNSTKASIIFTKRKNLKKPPNTYLGCVTYKNEIEIII